jgi:hypothetical protein
LFSVIAAAHHGSTVDIVLMVQISAHTPHAKLEEKDEELLRKSRIRLLYIPKFRPDTECFYSLVLEKFRILSLTEYTREMFLDYDIFPRHPLDYIFELSDPQTTATSITTPLLKENVVLGNKVEPSNAGLFLLKPNAGDYFTKGKYERFRCRIHIGIIL